MFEVKLKKPYKTCVKHTILNLGHALLTHHEAPRIHKPHKCHLEGSWEHLGASCGPSGGHLGAILGSCGGLPGAFMGPFWIFKNILRKNNPTPSTSHDSTTSLPPSTWPGGMREAA